MKLLRVLVSGFAAVAVALSLFYLMQYMVSGAASVNKAESYTAVDFVRLKQERDTETRKRELPKKPPPPKKPPTPPKMKVAVDDQVQTPNLKMDMPNIKGFKLGGGPFLGGGPVSADGDIVPLVRIAPQYPRKAAMAGTEGWVKVSFTITATGTVKNAQVADANPRRIFDRAAIRAILKWRFKPKMVDGKAVEQDATQVLEFKLEAE